MNNLILPVAGLSSRYPGMRPKWLLTMPDGKLMIEKSISKINLNNFNRIIIVCLKKHIQEYTNKKILFKILRKNISRKLEFVDLNRETSCQAETVLEGIKKANIKGSIFIKDCDNEFKFNVGKNIRNEVLTVNLNNVDLVDAKNKSYISLDKTNFVKNIIEKKIISNFFCCGGYSFYSAKDFINYSSKLLKKSRDVYISHVIYKMLLEGHSFTSKEVLEYVDWGTLREFRNYQRKHLTLFCDFDGCLFLNGSKFQKKQWKTKAIMENIKSLKEIQNKGFVELIITTSRPFSEKKNIKIILKNYNIKYKYILTDLLHSRRVLVNDFSNTNPFPSALAINLERDSKELASIFKSIHN